MEFRVDLSLQNKHKTIELDIEALRVVAPDGIPLKFVESTIKTAFFATVMAWEGYCEKNNIDFEGDGTEEESYEKGCNPNIKLYDYKDINTLLKEVDDGKES